MPGLRSNGAGCRSERWSGHNACRQETSCRQGTTMRQSQPLKSMVACLRTNAGCRGSSGFQAGPATSVTQEKTAHTKSPNQRPLASSESRCRHDGDVHEGNAHRARDRMANRHRGDGGPDPRQLALPLVSCTGRFEMRVPGGQKRLPAATSI